MEDARNAELEKSVRVAEADLRRQLHRLRSAEVDVPAIWQKGIDPRVQYPGECFCRAYHYVIDLVQRLPANEHIWLVHGEYGISTGHAWVELPGDVVFGAVLQRFYEKPGYYETQSASPWYKYSPAAAMIIAANIPADNSETRRYGGWHLVLKLPWADPQNPTVIEHDQVIELLITARLLPDLAKPSKKSRPATKTRLR
jgi:hypothetical protein